MNVYSINPARDFACMNAWRDCENISVLRKKYTFHMNVCFAERFEAENCSFINFKFMNVTHATNYVLQLMRGHVNDINPSITENKNITSTSVYGLVVIKILISRIKLDRK